MSRLPPNFVNANYSQTYFRVKWCLIWVIAPFSYPRFLRIIQIGHRGDVSRLWPKNTNEQNIGWKLHTVINLMTILPVKKLQSRQILSYHEILVPCTLALYGHPVRCHGIWNWCSPKVHSGLFHHMALLEIPRDNIVQVMPYTISLYITKPLQVWRRLLARSSNKSQVIFKSNHSTAWVLSWEHILSGRYPEYFF